MKNIIFSLITIIVFSIGQSKSHAETGPEQIKHHISSFQLKELQSLANAGKVAEGWKRLSEMADSYAAAATEVIQPQTELGVFASRFIKIHWINVAGVNAYKKNFLPVARQHFKQYVKLLSSGSFPNSREICISYRKAVTDHGLPPVIVLDGAWIRSGLNRILPWEIYSQVSTARWADSNVFLDVDKNDARKIIAYDIVAALSWTDIPLADGEKSN